MPDSLNTLSRLTFTAGDLFAQYPPVFRHANKATVFELAGASGAGEVVYARWREAALPETVGEMLPFEASAGVFEYPETTPADEVHWHLNFADNDLFFAYGSPLFAQDEMQVAEHPVLACLREALCAQGRQPFASDSITKRCTPVTVTGVQRRCAVNTAPSASSSSGLYGNLFARASRAQVVAATRLLNPATMSNILAIAAPSKGYGEYRAAELETILVTAYTGFAAAAEESRRVAPAARTVVVHTGFWGCGAFGSNRTVMTFLQLLAADLAGVRLRFWAVDAPGLATVNAVREAYELRRELSDDVETLLMQLEAAGHRWGVSDGN